MASETDPSGAAMLAALARDPMGTFPTFYDAFAGDVYTLLRRRGAARPLAEELCAETFLRAWRALADYPATRVRQLRPRPWLATIALNLVANEHRRRSRRPLETPFVEGIEPAAPCVSSEKIAESRLAAALARLPVREREAVVLRHVLDFPFAEIALALGVPAGTARSDVTRGLERLRRYLATTEEER